MTARAKNRRGVSSPAEYALGLDIGTSRVRALLAERTPSGEGRIVGVGTHPCRGLRRGEMVKLEDAVTAVQAAVEQAEDMAGVEAAEAWLGLSGSQVSSINARASVMVNNPSRGVTAADELRALNKVRAEKISEGCRLLHAVPQEYDVGSRRGVIDPTGMSARKLWLNAHLIQVSDSVMLDFARCCRQASLEVRGFTLQSLAAARAVLYAEETTSGVLLLDIGGGTSDYAVFRGGVLRHTGVLGVGGDHVSNDISVGLHIQINQAEEAKLEFASAAEPEPGQEDACPITPGPGGTVNRVSRRKLHVISRCRVEETFQLVRAELEREGVFSGLASGVVLTGGGALLEGIEVPAQAVFGLNVRPGIPWGLDGLEGLADAVDYSTVVGLVKYGMEQESTARPRRRLFSGLSRLLDKYF